MKYDKLLDLTKLDAIRERLVVIVECLFASGLYSLKNIH